jgi:hypothetical protein
MTGYYHLTSTNAIDFRGEKVDWFRDFAILSGTLRSGQ